MNHTERQLAEFRERFSKIRRRWKLTQGVAFAAWLLAAATGFLSGGSMRLMLPTVLLFGGVAVYSLLMWKCPACGKTLSYDPKLKFCHMCGVPLAE